MLGSNAEPKQEMQVLPSHQLKRLTLAKKASIASNSFWRQTLYLITHCCNLLQKVSHRVVLNLIHRSPQAE